MFSLRDWHGPEWEEQPEQPTWVPPILLSMVAICLFIGLYLGVFAMLARFGMMLVTGR